MPLVVTSQAASLVGDGMSRLLLAPCLKRHRKRRGSRRFCQGFLEALTKPGQAPFGSHISQDFSPYRGSQSRICESLVSTKATIRADDQFFSGLHALDSPAMDSLFNTAYRQEETAHVTAPLSHLWIDQQLVHQARYIGSHGIVVQDFRPLDDACCLVTVPCILTTLDATRPWGCCHGGLSPTLLGCSASTGCLLVA